MLKRRVAFIHTVTTLPAAIKSLVSELAPHIDMFSIVDESLLQDTIRYGGLINSTTRRLVAYLLLAQEAKAEVVMVTCSSVGPAADVGRLLVDIPVLRVDEPMAAKAIETGTRIGVAATLRTTLTPTADLIRRKAAGKDVTVIPMLCEGAFEALLAGDTARHDGLVREGLHELMSQVDVVVLAQASMARIVEGLPESDKTRPVLSSPRIAVEHLALAFPAVREILP